MKQTCVACAGNHFEHAFTGVADYEYDTYHKVNYIRCRRCGLLMQSPLPRPDQISSFYPLHYRNHLLFPGGGVYSMLKRREVTLVAKNIKRFIRDKNEKILEIGCGSGLLLFTLKNMGCNQLWGTDMTDAVGSILFQNTIVFKRANIEINFPFRHQFDLIILNHVIEHLRNPVFVLATCKKHLSDGGKIILLTPNSKALVFTIFKKYCDGLNAPRHLYIFNNRSMSYIQSSVGFKKLSLYNSPDPMQWAISLQNVLQNIPFLRTPLHYGLAWYTIFFCFLFVPIAQISHVGKKSASMLYVFE